MRNSNILSMKFQLIIKTKSKKISNHFNAQMTTISIFYGEQLHQTVSPIILLQPDHKTAFFLKKMYQVDGVWGWGFSQLTFRLNGI